MSLLGDLAVDGVFSGIAQAIAELPPSVRNTLTGMVGLCLAGGVGATIAMWPAGEDRPMWAVGLTVIALIYGVVLGMASGLTIANDRHERGFALFALLGCFASAALALISMAV